MRYGKLRVKKGLFPGVDISTNLHPRVLWMRLFNKIPCVNTFIDAFILSCAHVSDLSTIQKRRSKQAIEVDVTNILRS